MSEAGGTLPHHHPIPAMPFPFWRKPKPAKPSTTIEYRVVDIRSEGPHQSRCEGLVETWINGEFAGGRWMKPGESFRRYRDQGLTYTDYARQKLREHMLAHIAFVDDGRTTTAPFQP